VVQSSKVNSALSKNSGCDIPLVTSCSSAAREDGNLSFKEIEEKLAKNNDDWDACSFSTIDLVNYLYEFYDREKTSILFFI
jgi:hypothetical protein